MTVVYTPAASWPSSSFWIVSVTDQEHCLTVLKWLAPQEYCWREKKRKKEEAPFGRQGGHLKEMLADVEEIQVPRHATKKKHTGLSGLGRFWSIRGAFLLRRRKGEGIGK